MEVHKEVIFENVERNMQNITTGFNPEIKLLEQSLGKVALWFAAKPTQYTVQLSLKNENKEVVEAYNLPVAFRKLEVVGNKLLFNGQTLKIKGVNRHEFSPEQGWTITKEQMNEYCHAMGNSLGNISDYWKLIYDNDLLAGGFIWDWIDQALYKDPSDSNSGFVYGGDFGDYPNNGNFCVNGIIGADLKLHPHYYEMQKIYQPISFKLIKKNPLTFEIINHALAINTNEYQFSYQLIENGIPIREKVFPTINVLPQKNKEMVLADLKFDSDKETFIKLVFKIKDDCLWADKNHVIAWEQFQISDGKPIQPNENLNDKAELMVKENTSNFTISSEQFELVMDKKSGMISSLNYGQMAVITDNVHFNFWRALTDNDEGWKH